MSKKVLLEVPLNRVEGDLEIRVEVEDGIVTDAWSSGTMYRGFENFLVGRGVLDGLVITPRICGICSTAHLMAASRALDMISGAETPPDAIRLRNLALMVEEIQSDMRHGSLMFMTDFANPHYTSHPLYEEAVRRFTPLKGQSVMQTIVETKELIKIIAVIGGQWPHSSYMIPGGITSAPGLSGLLHCRYLLNRFKLWYQNHVLGCTLERFREVQSASDLDAWLDENPSHRDSDLGFYIRFARDIGLDKIGRGHGTFISFGSLELPSDSEVRGTGNDTHMVPAGFARGTKVSGFNQENISEHVACSWFTHYNGGRHPFRGETRPYATGREGNKYSWCKAPRYNHSPAETGPLAEMVLSANPLFTDMIDRDGPNVFVRELARLVRPAGVIPAMEIWLSEIRADADHYVAPREPFEGEGFGLLQAPRGALGHWVSIKDGKIALYQIITPTAWNASPRDSSGVRGPWEEALVGTPIEDPSNPIELGHVVRSYDACLVCTVHVIDANGRG